MERAREFDEMPLAKAEADEVMLDAMLKTAHQRFDSALKRIRRPLVEVGIATTPLGPLLIGQSTRGLLLVRSRSDQNVP